MSNKMHLNTAIVEQLARVVVTKLDVWARSQKLTRIRVYPVPRGGVPAAYAVRAEAASRYIPVEIVTDPERADAFIDDIIDSGATMRRFCDKYPEKPFFALVDKTAELAKSPWVVFPWEAGEGGDVANDETVEDNVVRILQYVGEDPSRGGLIETPRRVVKAWAEWTRGYKMDAGEILKVFEDGAENYDQMVVVKDIPIYSKCEHHLADIFGTAAIAYIPNGKVVGLSKLSRLADMFARRLQVQERLTNQIADALEEHLKPVGVGVVIKARHMCMESRGICQQGHHTVTTALRGALRNQPECRAEFMAVAN